MSPGLLAPSMRERFSNLIGVTLVAVAFVASLIYVVASGWHASGRSLANPRQVTIRFAHMQLEGGVRTALDKVAGEYTRLHPDVRVEQLAIPERIFPSWLITQLVGETAPDLIELGVGTNDEKLARFFVPLTDLTNGPNPYNAGTELADVPMRNTFFDGMRGGFYPNLFEYYGVPISNGAGRMFYNLDLLRAVTGAETMPATYEELIALCRRTQEYTHDHHVAMVPIAGSRHNAPSLMRSLFSSETQKLVERLGTPGQMADPISRATDYLRGRWSLDTPDVRAGFALEREIGQYMQPGFMQLERDDSMMLFVEGHALMIATGSFDATGLRQQAGFRMGIAPVPLPAPDDPEFGQYTRGSISEAGDANPSFGLTRRSPHPEIAWDFLRFLASQRMSQLWTDTSGWLPCIVGVKVPENIAVFLPRIEGYLPGLAPSIEENAFPDTNRLYSTNLHRLLGPTGGVDQFLNSIRSGYAGAMSSDLRRNALNGLAITQRGDTQFAAIAWLARTHPNDAGAAERFNSVLQAASINDRKFYYVRRAYQTALNPSSAPPDAPSK